MELSSCMDSSGYMGTWVLSQSGEPEREVNTSTLLLKCPLSPAPHTSWLECGRSGSRASPSLVQPEAGATVAVVGKRDRNGKEVDVALSME